MTEAQLHKMVCQFLDATLLPPAWYTCFPADGATRRGRIGLKRGVPDIMLIHDGITYWIELKSLNGNLSRDQQVTIPLLTAAGSRPFVARSLEFVIHVLQGYGIPLRPHKVVA